MQPEYQSGSEPTWWWKVALHLDEAQLALSNAMAHNVDDPRLPYALYDRLRDGQAILLSIFRAKGLVPRSTNSQSEVPMPPPPPPPPPSDTAPVPSSGDVAPVPPPSETASVTEQALPQQPRAADLPAGSDADQVAAADPADPADLPPEAVTEAPQAETSRSTALPGDPAVGAAGG